MSNQPIFLVETDLDYEYVDLLNDVIKYFTILLILHILIHTEYGRKGGLKLGGALFGDDFLTLLIFLALGFMGYNLIVRKLIVLQ